MRRMVRWASGFNKRITTINRLHASIMALNSGTVCCSGLKLATLFDGSGGSRPGWLMSAVCLCICYLGLCSSARVILIDGAPSVRRGVDTLIARDLLNCILQHALICSSLTEKPH